MKTSTTDAAARTAETFGLLVDAINRFQLQWRAGPTRASLAVRELQAFQCSESVMTAYSQGTVLLALAMDQSRAFRRTVEAPAQTFAPWICVRAVFESSALAAWLLDPVSDVRTRVKRSFALRYEGLEQAVKFVRVTGNQAEVDRRVKRIDEVENEALKLGYSRVLDKHGKNRVGIGQVMPTATHLVKENLDKEFEYRLYSAVAHGHQWALIHLGLRVLEEEETETVEIGKPGWTAETHNTRLFTQYLRPNDVIYLCLAAATSFAKPFWFSCQLFGWDTDSAKNLLEKYYSQLKISENYRFWRNE